MNFSYYCKSKYRDIQNISAFCRKYGLGRGNTFFLTLTFSNNITDKKESSRILNSLLTEIRKYYKDFVYISVAERQKRGSWHYHLICHSKFITMKIFKKFLHNYIKNSSSCLGFFKCNWTYGESVDRLSNYVAKYLCKLEHREKGIRYISYSRNFQRVCKMPFQWVGGKSFSHWRQPLREIYKIYGYLLSNFYNCVNFEYVFDLIKEFQTKSIDDFLLDNALVRFYSLSGNKFSLTLLNYSFRFGSNSYLADYFTYLGFSEKDRYFNFLLNLDV